MSLVSPSRLRLRKKKPYALVIGDVNSGKSALCIPLPYQIFANTPGEVKLAIADSKRARSSRFTAHRACPQSKPSLKTMTPIAPHPFFGTTFRSCTAAKPAFTALSAETAASSASTRPTAPCSETGALSEILPRILLMIDEYQSLFGGNTETAALLSELVRKGRTYGVHLIMASQRGVSESARNTFTAELKDHFPHASFSAARLPPPAAFFSDRAVDTGREKTGIAAAVLLKTGHALLNDEAGQTEARHRLRAMLFTRG